MLHQMIDKLIKREDLSPNECAFALDEMLKVEKPLQIAAFLALMNAKGETADELVAMVRQLRKHMIPVVIDEPVLDIVGTGGDGANTINISTGASILVASMGVKVAKHGNRSVSSACGSADVIEALGIPIELSADQVKTCVEGIGIGFMFAPHFHPAFQGIRALRKELKVRTLFNILGPLLNPASAKFQLIGVSSNSLLKTMAECLFKLGTKHSFVFSGSGLDELSCVGKVNVIEVTETEMREFVLDPEELGLPLCTVQDLRGGSPKENAEILKSVFAGDPGPIADTLALNAGAALYITGKVSSMREGVVRAKEALKKGAALTLVDKWRKQCL